MSKSTVKGKKEVLTHGLIVIVHKLTFPFKIHPKTAPSGSFAKRRRQHRKKKRSSKKKK
jgi:hypothetical protein